MNSKNHQEAEEAGESSTRTSAGSGAPLTHWCRTSGFQNCERIKIPDGLATQLVVTGYVSPRKVHSALNEITQEVNLEKEEVRGLTSGTFQGLNAGSRGGNCQ